MTANWCFYLFPTLVSSESQIFQNAIKIEGQKVDAFYTYLSISKYYKIHYGDFQDAWKAYLTQAVAYSAILDASLEKSGVLDAYDEKFRTGNKHQH